jgi:hypothetical protein
MVLLSWIWEGVKSFISSIANLIKKVIKGFLNFFRDVVDWFKNLKLKKGKHSPFLIPPDGLKELLKNAPIKSVGIFEENKTGVFKGVYDEDTETIIHHEVVAADALDEETTRIIGNEKIVVLS